jgi:hypothetical protein
VPNNPDSVPTSTNLSLQQFIVATINIPPTIDALAFADPVGEFFHYNIRSRILKNFYNSPPSFYRRMKFSRCFTRGFSSLKRILRASQTWKLPINIFIH